MKKFLLTVALMAALLWAKENSSSVEFAHASIAVEGGALYLLDDARQNLDDTYYGLWEVNYSFFRTWVGVIQMGYAYLSTTGDVTFSGIHQVNGRIGLDYPLPFVKPISLGAGFSCIWMRADDVTDENSKSSLIDNESEFGFYARLNLPILNWDKWRLGAKVYFERIWTAPETSETAWFGFYLQRNLW